MRHILQTRKSMPPPSSYLTYAGRAGALLSDLVDHLRYHGHVLYWFSSSTRWNSDRHGSVANSEYLISPDALADR